MKKKTLQYFWKNKLFGNPVEDLCFMHLCNLTNQACLNGWKNKQEKNFDTIRKTFPLQLSCEIRESVKVIIVDEAEPNFLVV